MDRSRKNFASEDLQTGALRCKFSDLGPERLAVFESNGSHLANTCMRPATPETYVSHKLVLIQQQYGIKRSGSQNKTALFVHTNHYLPARKPMLVGKKSNILLPPPGAKYSSIITLSVSNSNPSLCATTSPAAIVDRHEGA